MGHDIKVTGLHRATFHVFNGGEGRGKCLRIVLMGDPFIELDAAQVRELIVKLQAEWELTGSQTTLQIKRNNGD